jgi:hypothetical protein
MTERVHDTSAGLPEPASADSGHPSGDIELAPGRALSLRRAVLAGLAVSAVAYAASLDLATYTVAHTTCCG